MNEHAPAPDTSSSVAADQLKAFIARIERLEEEKAATSSDIKDVFAEAKGTGFESPLSCVASQVEQRLTRNRVA